MCCFYYYRWVGLSSFKVFEKVWISIKCTLQHCHDMGVMTLQITKIQLFVQNIFRLKTKKLYYECSTLLAICEGKPSVTNAFTSQRASNADISMSWHCYCPAIKWSVLSYIITHSKVLSWGWDMGWLLPEGWNSAWWRHRCWSFVPGIHWSPVNSPHKSQWRGALLFSLICAWINGWANNCKAGDLRCSCAHYDVTVMLLRVGILICFILLSLVWNIVSYCHIDLVLIYCTINCIVFVSEFQQNTC